MTRVPISPLLQDHTVCYCDDMEQWRDVPNTDGMYMISDQGRVAHVIGTNISPTGYPRANITTTDGMRHTRLIHQLVLEAFIGPSPYKRKLTRHLNDVRTDNRLSNLAWGTDAENTEDMWLNGGRTIKTVCPRGHNITGNNIQKTGKRGIRCRACFIAKARMQNAKWNEHYTFVEVADIVYKEVMQHD